MSDMLISNEDQRNLEHIILKEHVMTKIMLFQFSCFPEHAISYPALIDLRHNNLKKTNIDIIVALLKYVNYLFDVVIARRMDDGTPSSEISLNLNIDISVRRDEAFRVKKRTIDMVADIGQWIERRLNSFRQFPTEKQGLDSIQALLVAAYAYVIRSGVEAWSYNVSDQTIAHKEYSDYRISHP